MPDKREVGRGFATIALSWTNSNRSLTLREREEFRRGLFDAAENANAKLQKADNPAAVLHREAIRLTRADARALTKELDQAVADKKSEPTTLKKVIKELNKIADTSDFSDPVEYQYSHTARVPPHGLVTKVEELVLHDADEARQAATTIEARLETWKNLRDEMLIEMKRQQQELAEAEKQIPKFVADSESLIGHVLATRVI